MKRYLPALTLVLVIFFMCFPEEIIGGLLGERSHEYVSEDGGFVEFSSFKRPTSEVLRYFERYKTYRKKPNLKLYRTTKLTLIGESKEARQITYNDIIEKQPVDWRDLWRQEAIDTYIPTLAPVVEEDGIKLFFYNIYEGTPDNVYGTVDGKLFGISLYRDRSPNGTPTGDPIWSYTRDFYEMGSPEARAAWSLVNRERENLLQQWRDNRETIISNFNSRYDDLFW